ncbi:hypothetical protein ACN259_003536 [Vibrio cholerae]|uniref:hypothetical protein n=1 Tax=Vibrio cholerae TaxID=666 RepID=UPI00163BCD27|nr:hypothetical protein [Vibrio cholerae]HDL9469102.1 hypothetical protein [Vibrio cholerae]
MSFVVMRCQPLRRALVSLEKIIKIQAQGSENSAFIVQAAQFGFGVFPDADLVERVESSAVSKSLITNKL